MDTKLHAVVYNLTTFPVLLFWRNSCAWNCRLHVQSVTSIRCAFCRGFLLPFLWRWRFLRQRPSTPVAGGGAEGAGGRAGGVWPIPNERYKGRSPCWPRCQVHNKWAAETQLGFLLYYAISFLLPHVITSIQLLRRCMFSHAGWRTGQGIIGWIVVIGSGESGELW